MEQVEGASLLFQAINKKHAFEKTSIQSILTGNQSTMGSLMTLLRNSALTQTMPPSLLILEELTSIVADLAPFDALTAFLAKFDRASFRSACLNHKDRHFSFLSSTVIGIYPEKNLLKSPYQYSSILAFDREQVINSHLVGNQRWQKTRSILNSFYQRQASEYQKRCLQILLCRQEIKKSSFMKDPWYRLWVCLYSWTLDIFFEKDGPVQVLIKEQLKNIEENLKKCKNSSLMIIFYLVEWVINSFLFRIDKKVPAELLSWFFSTPPLESHLLQESLLTLLLKDCLNLHNTPCQFQQFEKRLKSIQEMIHSRVDLNVNDRNLLTSYLIPRDQILVFLKRNGMPFWKYGLADSQCQQLACEYLASDLHDGDWRVILSFLSSKDLKAKVLAQPAFWMDKHWRTAFLELCEDPTEGFLSKVSEAFPYLDMDKLIQSLSLFSQQWRIYFQMVSGQESQRQIELLESLLQFDLDSCASFRKTAKFPQDLSQIFVQCCLKHIRLLKSRLPAEDLYSTHKFIHNITFVKNLNGFTAGSSLKWAQYWESWIDILIEDGQVVRGLLSVQPDAELDGLGDDWEY